MSTDYRRFYTELLDRLDQMGSVPLSTNPETGEKALEPREGWFQETLHRRPGVFLCGGGHVSAALAPLLHMLDWSVAVQDDRSEFVTAERFPTAEALLCRPFPELEQTPFPPGTYFVIMTRGHQDDYVCLSALLKKRPGYLGMIGSRSKVAHTMARLRADGFSEEAIASVHTPVGLSIGAETPAEIAVSISAEIIQVFRSRPLNYLESPIIDGLRKQREPMVLATVLEKTGSSPRGAGTRMLVRSDGSIIGTVGGGAVEAAVIREAAALCGGSGHLVRDYDLSNSRAATLGMVCGGHIKVLLEPLGVS